MIAGLRRWLAALSLREQWGIALAASMFAATLFWFGVIRPLGAAEAAARARHAEAGRRLARIEAEVAALRPLLGAPVPTGPIEAAVRDRAAQAGFAPSTVSPQPGGALLIGIPAARPLALFGWVAAMERDGYLVEALATTDNGDQTISAQITFRPRAGFDRVDAAGQAPLVARLPRRP